MKPTCKWCGKRLYRVWDPIDWMDRVHGGNEPLLTRIVKRGTQWESVEGWWGQYGHYTLFCSKSCGFAWAVKFLGGYE